MPSSPNYVRDYRQEAASESAQRREDRRKREAARRAFEKATGVIPRGYEVDHIDPLSKGGSNKISNLQLQRSSANRSYPRTKKGAMKSKHD